MSYKDKEILKDVAGNPISQYFNKKTKEYEALLGQDGATRVIAYNPDGSPLDLSLKPIVDKLDQLTGTVIDEATRQANEQERVDQYELVEQKLADGEFVGKQGEKGDKPDHEWKGTELRFEKPDGVWDSFVDLKGDTGSIDNLTSTAIEEALGYKPQDPVDDKDTTYTAGDNIEIVDGEISVTGQLGLTKEEVKQVKVDNAVDSDTVSGHTVEKDVPADAEFTDTQADISGKADKSYVDNKVKTDVPSDAKFTDTTYNLTPYMKKKGSSLETYTEKLISTTSNIDLSKGNTFKANITTNTTFSITNAKGDTHSFTLIIGMVTAKALNFPSVIKWQDGEIPDMTEAGTYVLTFMSIDGGTNWLGMFGGMFDVSE